MESDLDKVILSTARTQKKSLMEAAKKRRDRFLALAAKQKNKEAGQRHKQTAKHTMLNAEVACKRLETSARNAADGYARAMRKAAAELAEKPVPKNAPKKTK